MDFLFYTFSIQQFVIVLFLNGLISSFKVQPFTLVEEFRRHACRFDAIRACVKRTEWRTDRQMDVLQQHGQITQQVRARYGQTSTSWRLLTSGCGRAGSAKCIKKASCVVLIKIEMNVSGSSRKGRDSLSPQVHNWWSTSDTVYGDT